MSVEQYNMLMFVVALLSMMLTAVVAIFQMRKTARQAMQQNRIAIFSEYTRRYHDIIHQWPEDIFNGTAELNERTTKYLRLYFDLCSEEFYLSQQKDLLPVDVWQYWQDGMKIMMQNELYQKCWQKLKHEYNREFQEFIEMKIININN